MIDILVYALFILLIINLGRNKGTLSRGIAPYPTLLFLPIPLVSKRAA